MRKFLLFLTPWAINTSYTQQIPTTVTPCSLHNVATATKNTVSAIGVHTIINCFVSTESQFSN